MSERLVGTLIEEIYEAGTGGAPWSTVGEGLIRLVRAGSASLFHVNPAEGEDGVIFRGALPREAEEAYLGHYRAIDLWTARAAAASLGRGPSAPPAVWISGTLVPDDEYVRSEFYADFARGLGLRHMVGAVLPLGQAGVMPIGLHRPDRAEPFAREEARLLERLLPHFRRAMQIRHRLRAGGHAEATGRAVLDALSEGVLVVDADLRVLLANAAAEAMAAGPGGAVRLARSGSGGERRATLLRPLDRACGVALAGLVRATAAGGGPGGAVALRDSDGATAAAALVYPLPRRLIEAGGGTGGLAGRVPGRALVLLRDLRPGPGALDPQSLRALFGLTRTEAEVALALAGGATKAGVAAQRRLRVSTVNTQVRSILAKTETANLRDLERLLGVLRRR
jgi:DNA-binding CsgD family transcriptional regulator/PAS domain-containing protein